MDENNNIMNKFATLLICLVLLIICNPLRAEQRNATEELFFAHGAISAQIEADDIQGRITTGFLFSFSFRHMAEMNRNLSSLFWRPSERVFAAYLLGRSEVFNLIADSRGEPSG